MAFTSVTERRRLTALRAAWLFEGTSLTLRAQPLVVFDGGTIRSVADVRPRNSPSVSCPAAASHRRSMPRQ